MNNYYTLITIINVFALGVMMLCVYSSNSLSLHRKRLFSWLFSSIMLAGICEWTGEYLNTIGSSARYLHIIVKFVELSVAPLFGFIFAWIIEKRNEKLIHCFMILHMFLEFLSCFFGYIFYVDAQGVYHHSNFYFIYIIAYFISFVYALVTVIRNIKKYQFDGTLFFVSMTIFLLFGVGVQLIYSGIKISYVSLSMTSIMLYVFTIELIQQTDELTGLLNRRGYENYIAHLDKKAVVVFFDVDKFKNVNDTYGHKYGDIALKNTGSLISKNYLKNGKCFRFGGDEFCVVLTSNLDRIEEFNHNLFMDLTVLRKDDEKMPNISIGYAYYDPTMQNIQDVVEEADQMMYKYKHNKEG